METEDQAQADLQTATTVSDPQDAANSTHSGTNGLSDYLQAVNAALSEPDSADAEDEFSLGQESADFEDAPAADEEAAEQEEQELSDEEDEPEAEAKASKRIRLNDPDDIAIHAIKRAKGCSLVEAARLYAGEATPTKHQDASQELPEARESAASVNATIKELMVQKREALAALEFDRHAELDEQIDMLREQRDELKVTEARENSRQEQAESEQFYANYAKSEDLAVGLYPSLAVAGSPMQKMVAKLEAEMLELGDDLYHSDNKPLILAKEAAKSLGVPMRKPGTAPATKTVQHRPIQPAGGNARTASTHSAQRASELIAGLKTTDDFERLVASMG